MKCICSVCGKEFNRKPALIKRAAQPVCSRECQNVIKRREWVEVECCVCGKPMLRRKSRLAIRPNPTCSKSCMMVLRHRLKYDESIPDEVRQTDRNYYPENRAFVRAVMKRDGYTCQICGKQHCILAAHHLNGYNWDIENRYNPDNGVTLCYECHMDFHSKYGRGNNTAEQFIEYANQNRRLYEVQSGATHRG